MDYKVLEDFCGSTFWSNNLTWHTESPRLTSCFANTVLVWIPYGFLWLFSPLDFYFVFNSKARDIPWNFRNVSKLVFLTLHTILCGFDIYYNTSIKVETYPVDIYTPLLKMISLLFCFTIIILHKKYGQRSTGLLFIFWFFVIIFGFPQFYQNLEEQWSQGSKNSGNISLLAHYCFSVCMFLLQWISDLPPSKSEFPAIKNPSPEESASFFSRITFFWFEPLLRKGFQKTLGYDDLWSISYRKMASQVFPVFDKHWHHAVKNNCRVKESNSAEFKKNDNNIILSKSYKGMQKSASIVYPLCKAFGSSFVVCFIFKLSQILVTFISPELLKYLIKFMENDEPQWHGYFYAILLLIFATLQSFFMSQNAHVAQLSGLCIKSALTSAIYRKALRLSNASRKESTIGEIVNLMAVDAQRFQQVLMSLTNAWSIPIQIALAVVFLWQCLGPSVLSGLALLLLFIPINSLMVNKSKLLQMKQMRYKDERTKIMNEILSGMKVLKLYAWEPSFEARVLEIRKKEADLLKKSAYLKAVNSFIWTCAPFMVSLVTFGTYVLIDDNNILDTSKAFVSLALFNILRPPLVLLPMVITNILQVQVSIKRINRFMNCEEMDLNVVTHDDKEGDELVLENASFSWGADEESTLQNLNLRVKPGSLVAIVGSVGSGKSSLISAFLGEMYKTNGKVKTKGSISYAPQSAWIQNCSLQDNILFGGNLNSRKYHKVIDACALKLDLEILPDGDQTEIGERGINLSGGQKQRVSLARSVYTDCDIYFLDDPLSAVDSHVGKHIFEDVISSRGILSKKTRILVTHSINFLPEMDLVVVLKNGKISESGTYNELLDKKGPFSEYLISHLYESDNEKLREIDNQIREQILNSNPEFNRQISRQKSVTSISSSTASSKKKQHSDSSTHIQEIKNIRQRLVKDEKFQVGKVKWSIYSNYLHAIGLTMFSFTLLFEAARQSFSVGSNLWLTEWSSNQNIIINGTQNTDKRNIYLGVYGLLGFGETLATFIGSVLWFVGAAEAGSFVHCKLLANIMRCPMSFFDTTPLGRIISRFSRDIDILDNMIPSSVKQLLSHVFTELATIFVITYSTPIFVFVIIPIGIMYYLIQRFYVMTSQQLRRLESVSRSPLYSHFSESVTGASVIRAYKAQDRFITESENRIDINQTCAYPSIFALRWIAIRLQFLGNLVVFFSALFSVYNKDTLNAGIVGLSITYALRITQSLSQLANTSADVETNIVAIERIKEYSELPQEAAWEITPSRVSTNWPLEGKLEFVDYSLRYREGLDIVLHGINIAIKGGEKVGIVGRTGAGKSSITLGLFRIMESASGKILIDGIDIAKVGLHSLRSRFSIIPQDPVLFSGTLRMNLDPFGHQSDEQVWQSLELAHLKSFVKGLPAGLQYEVTESGDNLSVGQRQLICLARALLRKTKILILDEATSAVDLETDDLIQQTIRKEFIDCTVLTIAHRINTIIDSDRVVVLDKGYVAEFEAPSMLLQNRTSIFYSMAHNAGVV